MVKGLRVLMAVVLAGSAGCAAVFGFDHLEERRPKPDASAEGGSAETRCLDRGVPPKPDASTVPDDASHDFFVATSAFDLGLQGAPAGGLNQDLTCTTS